MVDFEESGIGEGVTRVNVSELVNIAFSVGEIATGSPLSVKGLYDLTYNTLTITTYKDKEYNTGEKIHLGNNDEDIRCYKASFKSPCKLLDSGHRFTVDIYKAEVFKDNT